MHKDRVFDNQELPASVSVDLVNSLEEIGGTKNSLPENEIRPNTEIASFNGIRMPAVWYPHSSIPKKERRYLNYNGLNEFGEPKEYSILPSGWILAEKGVWLPLVIRLVRIMKVSDIGKVPDLLGRVHYTQSGRDINTENLDNKRSIFTSLGAAGNDFIVDYSRTISKWLVMDTKNVGYKSCGIGKRVYGAGCYFGGFWTCADRASAKKVDDTVCKTKNPPWPAKYFLAAIDDLIYNAGLGSSIKSGRIKLISKYPQL